MILLDIQESLGLILVFVALIILICIIWGIRKYGWKSLIFWLIVGFIWYLYISDAILN